MSTSQRPRLDEAVVTRGLAETRARAQAIIIGGGISVDGAIVSKPSTRVGSESVIDLVTQPLPYVSRGGLKLAHGLQLFDIDVRGRIGLDVGASTGGFTDVLLQQGASRVYAVDVGYGQLAWKLRQDSRVVVMERTNIRYLETLPEPISLAVVDVSFISLRQVLPTVRRLLAPRGEVVALIKPQFEAGRDQVGKKGVVRDPVVWRSVLSSIFHFAQSSDWAVQGLARSPIQGPAGNVEFLIWLAIESVRSLDAETAIADAIESAQ